MRIVNLYIIKATDNDKVVIDPTKLPTPQEFVKYVEAALKALKDEGVTEIDELNMGLIDSSNADETTVKVD